MLKKIKPRIYQQVIFNTSMRYNTLVVIPTGLGKTTIALMLAVTRLKNYPTSKILILSPTKPLCEQHKNSFEEELDYNTILVTGATPPEKREKMYDDARIIISTPQTIENDIISSRFKLEDVSLLVFDEAHRTTGDYSYVFIADRYRKLAKYERILGLTASPGSDKEIIQEVMKNLFIEKIEVRSFDDPDVKPYVFNTNINWIEVILPEEFKKIKIKLENCFKSRVLFLKSQKFIDTSDVTKTQLLKLQASLHAEFNSGTKDYELLKGISLIAEIIKIQHALELLESQGITQLREYFNKLKEQSRTTKIKAVKSLLMDSDFKSAIFLTEQIFEKNIDHPKLDKLKELVKNKEKSIIFTQYRDTASKIKEILDNEKISSKIFVGQAKIKTTGLSQKEQKAIIEEFKNNQFQVLISTSIGEEGLDIPSVDSVIFYEPIPSAIRHIQRKGRTGRHKEGSVSILVAKGTRDEAYRWTAFHKEKRMYRNLKSIKEDIIKEITLEKFSRIESNIKIVADHREKSSGIVKHLINLGVKMELKQLDVGDYLLSENTVVEFKTRHDFVDSIIDGRLLSQLKSLTKYLKPVLIIQGTDDIYSIRKLHPNSIRGMFSYIAVTLRIPVLFTKDIRDTSELLFTIAKREQETSSKDFTLHSTKPLTLAEQQEYVVSSFPGIGGTLSKPLLKHFKSVKNLVNADLEELMKIDLIGKKKAEALRQVFNEEYSKN